MQSVPRLYTYFHPEHYQIELDLDRVNRTFSGMVAVDGTWVDGDTIAFHARDLTITAVTYGKKTATFVHTGDTLTITPGAKTHGQVKLQITFTGTITDGMHGLYPCYYELDGEKKELLATQFESHHAREVFPCIDEPEAKATFSLALITEPGVTTLGNMPLASQTEANGRLRSSFDITPLMSPYLLAFVVGDLQKKTATTKNGTEVNVFATRAQVANDLDFALDTAVRSIEFFNDYFGIPYPLPKCDHVALPDFSSGAMENWGLITYREIGLLANDTTAISLKEYIAMVIAHETSHQWFGNLVTMEWWDDLWLNESFANFMEYVAVDAMFPKWNIWTTFATNETFSALRRDWLPGVQAVRTGVNHPDEIATLFDPSIVYAKGARLLAMLHRYIGEEAFRKGLTEYFKTHAYGNTTGDDLWQALSAASGKDIKSFMHRWIEQPGFPVVSIELQENELTISQQRFLLGDPTPDDSLWPIPLNASSAELPELLEQRTHTLTVTSSDALLLNTGNTGHFVASYDAPLFARLERAIMDGAMSNIDRLALLHETSLLARTGKSSAAELFRLLGVYKNEKEEPVWDIIARVIGDLRRLVESDDETEARFKEYVVDIALPLHAELGWEKAKGESEATTKLRATILSLLTYGEYQPVIETGLDILHNTDALETIDGELRGVVCVIGGKFGSSDDFDRLYDIYRSSPNAELQDDALAGLTSTKDSYQIEALLGAITDSSIVRPQDVGRWYAYLIGNRYSRSPTWEWMTSNWDWLTKTFAGDKSYDMFPRYAGARLSTREWQNAYESFFGPLKDRPALKRAIELGIKDIASWADWHERDFEQLKAVILA